MNNNDNFPTSAGDKSDHKHKQERTTYGSIPKKEKTRKSNGKQNIVPTEALLQDAKKNQESESLLDHRPEEGQTVDTRSLSAHGQASQLQETPKAHTSLTKTICVYLFWTVICLLLALMFLRVVFYALYSTSRQSMWTWY
jgi:hypothetical protein